MTRTITTNAGETLTLAKLGKARITFGWRQMEALCQLGRDGTKPTLFLAAVRVVLG